MRLIVMMTMAALVIPRCAEAQSKVEVFSGQSVTSQLTSLVQAGFDTLVEDDLFFSHRRRTLAKSGPIGHQISIIRPE